MEKKKVVGFSFGRKMSNTEVMIKEALLECERAGMEIQFVRCDDLNIHICTGCCACVGGLMSGKGRGTCVHKDDEFYVIEEALMLLSLDLRHMNLHQQVTSKLSVTESDLLMIRHSVDQQ